MFEFLKGLPSEKITGGVYYAIRILVEGELIDDPAFASQKPWEGPSAEEEKITQEIVDEILRSEGKELQKLTLETKRTYVAQLARELREILKTREAYNEDRGDLLLDELRKSHPSPERKHSL